METYSGKEIRRWPPPFMAVFILLLILFKVFWILLVCVCVCSGYPIEYFIGENNIFLEKVGQTAVYYSVLFWLNDTGN